MIKNELEMPTSEILIVDDVSENLNLIENILKKSGYRVRFASDGNLALRSIKAKIPDLILLDVQLAGIDGFEVCRRLKEDEATRAIPVIFLTVHNTPKNILKGFEVGGVDYIRKPFTAEEVIARVKAHLDLSKLQLELKKEMEERKLVLDKLVQSESVIRNKLEQEKKSRKALLSILQDQKESSNLLAIAHNKFRDLVNNIDEVIITTDSDGIISFVSAVVEKKLGYLCDELIGKSIIDIASEEHREVIKNHFISCLEGKRTSSEISLQTKAGYTKIFVLSSVPELMEKEIGLIRSSLFDITERKTAENEVRKLSRAVEQSGSSIIITNLKGDIEYVNPKFIELTGYSAEEVLGKNPRILKSDHTSSMEYKNLWDTITNGRVWRGEFHNKKKNGELYWESATISPIKDVDGIIINFIAVKEDITQQKAMSEQIRQMQKLEGLGTLAGGIAHDFNNILGIILAYITSFKRFKDDAKKLDLAVDTIIKAVDRGRTLVQQILMFARKTETSFGAVDVNEVVMEIMTMIYETFPKLMTYSQNFDKSIPYINADRSQLHQVLMNLCVNARDAMPKGGTLTINTRMISVASLRDRHPDAVGSSYVCIEVSDTGEGMSEETRNRIFEPFFTTKGIGKGTGLGLSVSYGVIQTHKGFIDVESELGHGTTFRIYLPASRAVEPIVEKDDEVIADIRGGTETLLVIEDEEMLLTSIQMVLVDKGYNVISAKDGLTALKIYQEKQKQIALVMTDLGLPNISGLEVSQKIKSIKTNERIILATGYLDPEMKKEFVKAGIKHFLHKPYDLKKVLKVIREVLDEK